MSFKTSSRLIRSYGQVATRHQHRSFTVSALRNQPNIYVSESNDPHFNLAFEDWLFRKTESTERILYLYRNTPSVIIGRNQNPWKEINLHKLNELGIPFVRRKSGGGTVYHDLGNTNYCVFVPRLEFNRNTNAELVASALNELSIPAYVNDRNDICVDKFKMRSAFKLVNNRAYHHGTMLIDAKLSNLRGVLGTTKESMITKGVASVPSPVRNLVEWTKEINHDSFVEQVAKQFSKRYEVGNEIKRVGIEEVERNDYVRETMNELKSWEWQYGQSPEFTHEMKGFSEDVDMSMSIRSRHGLVTSATVSTPPDDADLWSAASEVCQVLEGDRYGSLEETTHYVDRAVEGSYRDKMKGIVDWLKREM